MLKTATSAAVMAAALAFGAAGCSSGGEQNAAEKQDSSLDGSLRVTRVIDGDTVVMERLGKVRLIGVNTPEKKRCFDDAATRFTRPGGLLTSVPAPPVRRSSPAPPSSVSFPSLP